MDTVLMQTLAEKIQALEKDLGETKGQMNHQQEVQKEADSRVEEVEQGFKKLLPAFSFPVQQVERLSSQLNMATVLLSQPRQQEVRHHHHVSIAVIIAAVLFIIVVVLSVLLAKSLGRSHQERESDLKYRYLNLSADTGLQRILFHTDSLYLGDAGDFRKKVLEEEARLHKQYMFKQQIEEKEKEVKLLKEKMGKKF